MSKCEHEYETISVPYDWSSLIGDMICKKCEYRFPISLEFEKPSNKWVRLHERDPNPKPNDELDKIINGVWASGVYDQADGEQEAITYLTPIDPKDAKRQIQALFSTQLKTTKDKE
jgi:hypothetical protein